MNQFRQAIVDMVEVGDVLEIESLANRLRPFRVETDTTTTSKLKLVLEDDLSNGEFAALAGSALPSPPTTVCQSSISDNHTDENALGAQMDSMWPNWLLTPASLSSPMTGEYVFTPAEMPSSASGDGDIAMCGGDGDTAMCSLPLDGGNATGLEIALCDTPVDTGLLIPSNARPVLPFQGLGARRSALPARVCQIPRNGPFGSIHASPESLLHPTEIQRYIRSDCASYLQENAERWTRNGLWQHTEFPNPDDVEPGTDGLRIVYNCICKLEVRMEDDAIRNRIAIIVLHEKYDRNIQKTAAAHQATGQTSRGRGYASILVDNILAQIHGPDWTAASPQRRKELRAKFHDRKRYGKRWSILAQSAGHGILFLCAPQLVAIVNNTRVPCEHLRVLGDMLFHADTEMTKVLQAFNHTARSLIHGPDDDDDEHDLNS